MPRSVFRPCIDLHDGQVKQIVGGTLSESEPNTLKTNFTSSESPSYYAKLYQKHGLTGGHVIKLGKGNDDAAKMALSAWPGGMQVGGGITIDNAQEWLNAGADKVIITSWLFPEAVFSLDRLRRISETIGRDRLVVDLSCRRHEGQWIVAMNKWQTLTDLSITQETLALLGKYCSEFLIHAADVEGLCQGIDEELVKCLGEWTTLPMTYAGGAKSIEDLALVDRLSQSRVDLTFGSALDIFGGKAVRFSDCVIWNQEGNNTLT
ncbi:MAG: Phosphoribosylformimino-5-aminoimidazole carboxamide ribotide isomerase [Piptocephalis tieghemiana]|nr:MAG: Phosphoribosylformimino-5-aminoimidazole carboxamide ribotide isomerase [Piptocephalis tieghemiana]